MIELYITPTNITTMEYYNKYNNVYTKRLPLYINESNPSDYGIICKMMVDEAPSEFIVMPEELYHGKFTINKKDKLKIVFENNPVPVSIYSGIQDKDNTCKPFIVKIV